MIRALALFLCFFMDVHVRADEPISAPGGKKTVEFEKLKITLDTGSVIEPRGTEFHLVRGQFFIEAESSTKLATPFARLWCEAVSPCKGLFERTAEQLIVRSLEGEWRLTRTGESQVYRVPEAMQMRLGLVTDDGKAEMDFPQSLPWLQTLKTWGHLFSGKPDEFKGQVAEFRERWRTAVDTATLLHTEGAKRTIASHDEALAKEEALRRREERETLDLKRQMRERNYLNP